MAMMIFQKCQFIILWSFLMVVTCTHANTELGSNRPSNSEQLTDHQQQLINDREENAIDNQGTLQQERIDAIKQDILAKLGLSSAPDVSGINITAAEKRHLLRMYRRSLEEVHGKTHVLFDEEQQQAKNFYSFTATPNGARNTTELPRTTANTGTTHRLYFNLDIPEPDDARKETVVTSATLKLYKYATPATTTNVTGGIIDDTLDDLLTITVCQMSEEIIGNEVRPGCRLVDTRVVATRDSGWIDFNVAEMVSEWIREPATNFGLKVTIARPSHHVTAADRGFVFRGESITAQAQQTESPTGEHQRQQQHQQPVHHIRHGHDHLPLLNVIAQERLIVPSNQRMRRSVGDERHNCTIGDGETRCCRYSLWISFAAIRWNNWVIAPDGYWAHYCDGRCPHCYKVAHSHALMRSFINTIYPRRISGPMCSATKYSPLSIAHFQDGRQVVSLFDDMIVQTCKCV